MAALSFVVPVIPEVDTTSAFFVFERAEAPPKVNDVDADGKTVLWKAAEAGNLGEVGKLLNEYGDRLDVNRGDKEGFTPLAIAVQNGHVNVVKLLLTAKNIKVNQSVQKGREAASTPLYIGCATFSEANKAANTEIVRALLGDPSVNVNLPNHQGETPIFAAALCCSSGG